MIFTIRRTWMQTTSRCRIRRHAGFTIPASPEKRPRKVTLLNEPIVIEAGPTIWDPIAKKQVILRIEIPAGTPQAKVGNLLYKQLIVDLTLSVTNFDALKTKLKDEQAAKEVRAMVDEFVANIG